MRESITVRLISRHWKFVNCQWSCISNKWIIAKRTYLLIVCKIRLLEATARKTSGIDFVWANYCSHNKRFRVRQWCVCYSGVPLFQLTLSLVHRVHCVRTISKPKWNIFVFSFGLCCSLLWKTCVCVRMHVQMYVWLYWSARHKKTNDCIKIWLQSMLVWN